MWTLPVIMPTLDAVSANPEKPGSSDKPTDEPRDGASGDNLKPTSFACPAWLETKLGEIAKANHRSRSQQIVKFLEESVKAYERKTTKPR
jgi:hypothetical protein